MKILSNKYFIVVVIVVVLSCSKKNEKNKIPNVPVDFEINYNSVQYNNLNAINGWVYVTGGYKGIIIYRASYDEFKAYDRCCPFDPLKECERITVEPSSQIAIDSCCGSRFFLANGSPLQGSKTNLPLKEYKVIVNGNILRITNY